MTLSFLDVLYRSPFLRAEFSVRKMNDDDKKNLTRVVNRQMIC